ncbi:MAG: ATP-binding protein [Deltaproteobacteria bacterium]|nr:ATP-binding protein [Deltaproteobacteria bacterium]
MREKLRLGEEIEPGNGQRSGVVVELGRDALTTHGVIVGMTGSGKTGLGVVLLEEVVRSGVPVLVLDPKGDMGNLALTFPSLQPEAFTPWVDPGEARRRGITDAELGAEAAATWSKGLASWGLGKDDVAALQTAADVTIYTPGSTSGTSLSVLGSLAAPPGDFDADAEDHRAEIEAFVSSLLVLAGIDADPMASREHILLAHLIERAWRAGQNLDLGELVGQVAAPPLRRIGVFELDRFFPQKERDKLAMRLNGLVASPSFQPWLQGEPLDIDAMLYGKDGKARAAVVYLPHLSDEQRMFAVTLVLSKVVSWMRRQSGTSDLRALIYMDEVFGFCPPTGAPPAKRPILTLLKQARAHGVGVVLATQNPVDLDYKAMSNAGAWMVGRLSTERDKARIVEALRSASGEVDTATLDRLIGGLGKRQFVLLGARYPTPRIFTSRFALSYLRGPLTRDEVERLAGKQKSTPTPTATSHQAPVSAAPRAPNAAPTPPAPAPTPTKSVTMLPPEPRAAKAHAAAPAPSVAPGIRVAVLDPAAPWATLVGAVAGGSQLHAVVAARIEVFYDVPGAAEPLRVEWEAVWPRPADELDPTSLLEVDYDERDLGGRAPDAPHWHAPPAPIASPAWWAGIRQGLVQRARQRGGMQVYVHEGFAMASRPGESEESFRRRTRVRAEAEADAAAAELAQKYAAHAGSQRERIAAAAYAIDERAARAAATLEKARVEDEQARMLGDLVRGRANVSELARRAEALARAEQDAARSRAEQQKIDAARAEIDAFEARLGSKIAAIHRDALARADATVAVDVTPRPGSIAVQELALVWVPQLGAGA